MKFKILINDLHLKAIIGILPCERENTQEIAVDLEAIYEVDSAIDSANIIDYAKLREMILEIFKLNNFFYLESALISVQKAILAQYPKISALNLSIEKLEIFDDCTPKVVLKWEANDRFCD